MGSPVVTQADTLVCTLQGRRALSLLPEALPVKLTVGGSHVVVVADAGGQGTYLGCTYADNSGPHPCSSTTVASEGAARLTAGGRAVLLTTDTITATNDIKTPPSVAVTVDIGTGPQRLTAT